MHDQKSYTLTAWLIYVSVNFHGGAVTQTSFQLKEAYFVRYAMS